MVLWEIRWLLYEGNGTLPASMLNVVQWLHKLLQHQPTLNDTSFLWKIYLNLEPTNQLNWKIWTCDIPHPGMRLQLELANLALSVWGGDYYQPVIISYGCHHGLQVEAQTSHLLQFYCISDSSNFISLSVCVCERERHWVTDLLSLIFFVFDNWFYSEYFPPP